MPLDVAPLKLKDFQERGIYTRSHDPKQSTEFTYLRFFLPYLNNYEGWALFADDDFLWLGDVAELISKLDDRYAVMCVKHDYIPLVKTKLANVSQEPYPRKNWSSLIFWNCSHKLNKLFLTPNLIDGYKPSTLHRFKWLNDIQIGNIDKSWNWLVGYYKEVQNSTPKALHYTDGGPWLEEYKDCEYSSKWYECINI